VNVVEKRDANRRQATSGDSKHNAIHSTAENASMRYASWCIENRMMFSMYTAELNVSELSVGVPNATSFRSSDRQQKTLDDRIIEK